MAHTLTSGENAAIRLDGLEAGREDIEVRLLLEGIRLRYGHHFRECAVGPLRRSIRDATAADDVSTISAYLALGRGESLVFSPEAVDTSRCGTA